MKLTPLLLIAVLSPNIAFSQSTETNLTNNAADDRYASYSPDGSQIIFESNRDGNWEIYRMNIDGSDQQRLTSNTHDDRRPSWHPSGNQIVFESVRGGKNGIYQMNLSDLSIDKVNTPELEGELIFPRYAPDGNRIAVGQSMSSDKSRILIIDTSGKVLVTIADYGFRSTFPRWSSEGESILFFSRHETNNKDDELYIINLLDKSKKRLTNWPKHNFCPVWSKDNKKIAFVQSMEDTRPEIFVMNTDGSQQTRITNNQDGDTLPDWSPDGKSLIITGYRDGNYEICLLGINKN